MSGFPPSEYQAKNEFQTTADFFGEPQHADFFDVNHFTQENGGYNGNMNSLPFLEHHEVDPLLQPTYSPFLFNDNYASSFYGQSLPGCLNVDNYFDNFPKLLIRDVECEKDGLVTSTRPVPTPTNCHSHIRTHTPALTPIAYPILQDRQITDESYVDQPVKSQVERIPDDMSIYSQRLRMMLLNHQKRVLNPSIKPFQSEIDLVTSLVPFHLYQFDSSPPMFDQPDSEEYKEEVTRLANLCDDIMQRVQKCTSNTGMLSNNDEILAHKPYVKYMLENIKLERDNRNFVPITDYFDPQVDKFDMNDHLVRK